MALSDNQTLSGAPQKDFCAPPQGTSRTVTAVSYPSSGVGCHQRTPVEWKPSSVD